MGGALHSGASERATPSTRTAPLTTLKRRKEFLAAARARNAATPAMIVQGRRRAPEEGPGTRVGYTCSKKVGNAPMRNRAKRRLRAAAALVLPRMGVSGWDYVLIGRADVTVSRPFGDLVSDLEGALGRIHAGAAR